MTALLAAAQVAAVAGGSSALLFPSLSFLLRRNERHRAAQTSDAITTALDPIKDDMKTTAARLARIEAQFGPNGGGLREQVNTISIDVRTVRVEQAGLARRFDDHLTQSSQDRDRLSDVEHALMRRQA